MSFSVSGSKFRVAICGAGIGGLILAITIGKYDPSIPIDLYEAHDSLDTVGVGITIQRHDVLMDLGLFDEFKQIFTHRPERRQGFVVRRSDIREGGYHWFQRVHRGNGPAPMHRQHMVTILEKHLPASCTIHSRKRLVNYTECEHEDTRSMSLVRLEFADGTTAMTNVLIGADGIRSTVRKTMFKAASKDCGDDKADLKQYIDATFTGVIMYRTLIPAEALREENPDHVWLREMMLNVGKGRKIVTYPIAKGTMINFVASVRDLNLTDTQYKGHWVSESTRDELIEHFNHFESDARVAMKFCENPSKWALHVVKPLPFCVRNTVALIGDACHAMTPYFGAGAGQAINDAFILGRLLAHPLTSLSRVPDALRVYEEVRLPIAQFVASISLSVGRMYTFTAPGYYDGARTGDDLDESGIGSYEREGMDTIKREIFQWWDMLDHLPTAQETWEDTEKRLRALAGPIAN